MHPQTSSGSLGTPRRAFLTGRPASLIMPISRLSSPTMLRIFSLAVILAVIPAASADWPWWRGPNRDGSADAKTPPPTEWSDTQNIAWKAKVPGRGHGSPIVVGDRVFLQTAD